MRRSVAHCWQSTPVKYPFSPSAWPCRFGACFRRLTHASFCTAQRCVLWCMPCMRAVGTGTALHGTGPAWAWHRPGMGMAQARPYLEPELGAVGARAELLEEKPDRHRREQCKQRLRTCSRASVQQAAGYIQRAMCDIHRAMYSVQRAACTMQHTARNIQRATCGTHYTADIK